MKEKGRECKVENIKIGFFCWEGGGGVPFRLV